MEYFEYNDAKGRDARRAVELNRIERKAKWDYNDVTLFMSARDLKLRREHARLMAQSQYGGLHQPDCYGGWDHDGTVQS